MNCTLGWSASNDIGVAITSGLIVFVDVYFFYPTGEPCNKLAQIENPRKEYAFFHKIIWGNLDCTGNTTLMTVAVHIKSQSLKSSLQ